MRAENIAPGMHRGFLLVLSRGFDGRRDKTYVLADAHSSVITAYGPCPYNALAAIGRDGPPATFEECAHRAILAADYGYFVDASGVSPMCAAQAAFMGRVSENDAKFFSAETAALAAAVSGWPDPVCVFSKQKDNV